MIRLELSGWTTVIFEPFVCAAASIDTHMLFATRASRSDGVGSPPLLLNQRENVSTVPDAFLIAVKPLKRHIGDGESVAVIVVNRLGDGRRLVPLSQYLELCKMVDRASH